MNRFGHFLVSLGATPPPDSDFWYKQVQAPSGSYLEQFAGGSSALRISTVYACVSLRADTIGSLPCQIFKRVQGGKEVDPAHPLYKIVHDAPNDYMTAFEFWARCEQDLCLAGNFYSKVDLNQRKEVVELHPLTPEKMTVHRDKQTDLIVFEYENKTYSADQILHVPGLGYNGRDRLTGMTPISSARNSFELASHAISYGANFFRNNAAPHAYISHPLTLSEPAKKTILDYMMDKFGGVRNAGKLGILDEGMEIKTVPTNHTDLQYLELINASVNDIARLFRVPQHKIGQLDRSTNNNIEHQGIEWATDTIRPECTRIEKRLNQSLLGPREGRDFLIEFNLDALMRGDAVARGEFYNALHRIGAINANEARVKENMVGYPGGDTYFIQGAMVPVEVAANAKPSWAEPAPPPAAAPKKRRAAK